MQLRPVDLTFTYVYFGEVNPEHLADICLSGHLLLAFASGHLKSADKTRARSGGRGRGDALLRGLKHLENVCSFKKSRVMVSLL